MIRLTAHSTDDTRGIATAIAMLARAGDMFVLIGEMGSGKTTFSQHFAHALGVEEPVTSPTFNLLHNYVGGELDDLGLTDLQEAGGVMLVEWGDVVGDALGTGLVVKLAAPENADTEDSVTVRQIDIDWRGMQWETRWDKLRSALDTWAIS
jgi:tRNA threonylcarbamoyladenosine biosynthesis protein TsaE